jgi:preprotein translocase subunit YajC
MKKFLLIFALLPGILIAQTDKYVVDALVSPKKQERIITVGGISADIQSFTNEAIQIAVDALPPEGGTVKLNNGRFIIKAPVRLKSNVKLIGSGPETILGRIDGYHSRFIVDADFGELKLTVEDASR